MSLLEIMDMSHSFGDKRLYKQVNLELYKGEHLGVVGQNGTGKSTLIHILTGEVIPDEGTVRWQSNLKIGYLDQYAMMDNSSTIREYLQTAYTELYEIEIMLQALYEKSAATGDETFLHKAAEYQQQLDQNDFYLVDSQIDKIATGLGLDAIGCDRVIETLSGGQRAKVILAKLLLEQPDVLVLDEPTNFLDTTHIEWLSDYLMNSKQAFIVVSHNFAFLDRITNCICDIEGETIRKYYGKYTEFLKQKAHLREDHIRQYYAQQKKIEETEAFIRKNIAGVNSKNAKGRRKQLERMERIAPPTFVSKPFFNFRELPLSVHKALEVKKLEVGYNTPLLPELNFVVTGGSKFVITGFNGIGKSTLLKTLVGTLPSISGSYRFAAPVNVGYFEQDLEWDNDQLTPLQIISESYPQMNVKEIRRHLAGCGVKDTHVMQSINTLSGGEQSKVKLCRLMLSACNLLILDEPTNHLDAETKTALQKALQQFKGSVILVSHEPAFYKDWADRIFNIEGKN
ncbi:ABC-F family ATP-binding cassette domain-containing protein [Paenibacillus albiflavus]|uniref:ABC-F family ATP-binding cassette domain-containing protein n=1 Tax=Paenibacillus albiflavus TaxID=2545760 RepID=A0A4R4EL39_9BACL|nr:ABC-F family ATP-binding cassette domain-containing protein [Paenibacillus albiflavus]TCZ80956.1 ABC-F family ATP-binding cassette domain-containing protein [Paenibacillus albiflavus]